MALGEAGPVVFCNHFNSWQLSLYKWEPSLFCPLAESFPLSCRCSCSWGRRIHAILDVLSCSSQWIFFHISVHNTDVWQQEQSKLLLPSLQQALRSTGPRAERESCTYRAVTALPTGITRAEDRSHIHAQTSRGALVWKREFFPKW